MLQTYLKEDSILDGVKAKDWEEAVCFAAKPLIENGSIQKSYLERVVAQVHSEGPYIVLAKGIAVAHARPKEDVLCESLSLVRLQEPVSFGHPTNDPVRLVFMLAARDDRGHIAVMMDLAQKLSEGQVREKLLAAPGVHQMYEVLIQ